MTTDNRKDNPDPARLHRDTPSCIQWLSKAIEMAYQQDWSRCRDFIVNADWHARQAQLDEISDVCGIAHNRKDRPA